VTKIINRKSLYIYLLLGFFLILGFLLRSVYLEKNPPGLNWDEASVGYNAYTLSQTGRDEFGKPWPIYMEAFGEYKIGLYSMFWRRSSDCSDYPSSLSDSLMSSSAAFSFWLPTI